MLLPSLLGKFSYPSTPCDGVFGGRGGGPLEAAGLSCFAGRLTYPSDEGSLEGNISAPLEGRFSYPLILEGARLGGKAGAGGGVPMEREKVSSRTINHVQCPVLLMVLSHSLIKHQVYTKEILTVAMFGYLILITIDFYDINSPHFPFSFSFN